MPIPKVAMMPSFIIRLDDAHPEQHQEKWDKLEEVLDREGVKPIVAIIPKNEDDEIKHGQRLESEFWEKAKKWQVKGWGIAIHGLNHKLISGKESILPISEYSEFSGKSVEVQLAMLNEANDVFLEHGLRAKYFIAPAHGYDDNTLLALKRTEAELIISDSFGFRPYKKDGIRYLPQQLWRGRKGLFFGTWTICLHPSNMTESDIDAIELFIKNNIIGFTSLPNNFVYKKYSFQDRLFQAIYTLVYKFTKLKLRD